MNKKGKYKETIEFNSSVDQNKLSVVKSNKLVEAKYKLTLNEQRLILLMVSMIKPEDEDFKNIRIRIKDLKEILDLRRKDLYEEVPEITKKLMSRVLEIKDIEEKRLLQISWLSSAEYLFGEGVVELSFDPKLKPYLLKLKEAFTIYNLQSVLKLRSSYAIRFYELLKQYEKIGNRKFKIKELKDILGIGKKEYKLYGDFKRRVILPAQKELREKTDIYFEFEEVKKGRKVVELIFNIYKNPNFKEIKEKEKDNNQILALDNINKMLFDNIKKYTNLSEEKIINIFQNYDEDLIQKSFEYTLKLYKQKKIENLTGFFLSALKDNYFKLSPYEEEKLRKKKEAEEQDKLSWELERELSDLNKEYREKIGNKVINYFEKLPLEEQEELKKEFEKFIKKNVFLEREFLKKGFDSEFIKPKFRGFLLNKFREKINFEYIHIIEFLEKKKFDFEKLKRVKNKYKRDLAYNLAVLLYWKEKMKKLNIPENLLLPYHLEKLDLDSTIEDVVVNYLYDNLDGEEKEKLLNEVKKIVDNSLLGKHKKEALKYNIKLKIKEKFNL